MDWCRWVQKINIKLSSFIISFLLMVAYLYYCIHEYFEYETMTSVGNLELAMMPEVDWVLCGDLESLYNGSHPHNSSIKYEIGNTLDYVQIIDGLEVNGTKIDKHGQPFIREKCKCWQVLNVPPLGELSFVIRTRKEIEIKFFLTRDKKGEP